MDAAEEAIQLLRSYSPWAFLLPEPSLEHVYTYPVRETVVETAIRALREDLGQFRAAQILRQNLNAMWGPHTEVYGVRVNNPTTRARALERVLKIRAAGLTQCRINIVDDSETTDICRALSGRTFPLDGVYAFAERLLDVEGPADLRATVTLLSGAEIREMSSKELVDRGCCMPPFHLGCRSQIVGVSSEHNLPG